MRRLGFPVSCLAVLSIVAGVCAPTAAAQDLRPPVTTVKPKVDTLHGEVRTDDYLGIRENTNPDVLTYQNAENAYTEAKMRHTEELQKNLYDEMLSRIKETDAPVPYRDNGYYYSTRTEKGKNYAIRVSPKGSMSAPDAVYLDDNVLAAGRKFSQV